MTDIRVVLHGLMQRTIADEQTRHTWTYHAIRPMPVPANWKEGQNVIGDCSKGCQFLCKWAGAPDPMNNSYQAWGNSQTLWLTLQHLDKPSQLKIGDIVTFGNDGDEHAAMVMEAGNDPLLWSFGHQGAPNSYRLSQDRREQQYLRLRLPDYVPTPQERLRGRTGWFAWVAWKLGEGDWHSYKPGAPYVRPNVPKVIPPLWWKRYAAFLLNRKKANKPS